MIKKRRFLLFLILLLVLLFLLSRDTFSQEKQEQDSPPTVIDWMAKINEAKKLVANIALEHSTNLITYREYHRVAYQKIGLTGAII